MLLLEHPPFRGVIAASTPERGSAVTKKESSTVKTTFNKNFVNVLAINGKTLADAALLSTRTIKSFRTEAAQQCLSGILSIRAIRIEQERAALAAQAAKMGMNKPIIAPAATVEPEPVAAAVVAVVMPKGVTKTFKAGATFGPNFPKNMPITVNNHNPTHPMVPQADPNYVFRTENVSDVCSFLQLEGETSMYVYGPTGCGKSSLFIEMAARLGIPLYMVVGHNRMETPELFGGFKLNREGGMDWIAGPITDAAKNDAWVLIDEGDLLDPAALAGLNGVCEGRSFLIPETGETIIPGPNFRIFFTANTNGAGDSSGLYQGTLRQNLAFMDRFFITEVKYPNPEVEVGILEKVAPTILQSLRERMVQMANEIRGQFLDGKTEITLSTRTLVRWARAASFYQVAFQGATGAPDPMTHALDRALGFRAEKETRQSLHELYQRHFGV